MASLPRLAALALLLAASITSFAAAQDEGWRIYRNPRFGFVLPVPPGMQDERPPENGGGQSFVSRDGRVRLVAWGSFNVDGFDDVETRWRQELATEGRTVTYKRKTAGWFVVSGIEADGSHFYLRHEADAKHSAGWLMTYPAADEARASAWIERIAKGYEARLGQGADRIE